MSGVGQIEHSSQKGAQVSLGARQASLPKIWWSIDPGEVHVGLAIWEQDRLKSAEEVSPRALLGMLMDFQPPFVVIESFSLRSTRWTGAQSKQAVNTLKLIGGVEALSLQWGAVVVEQQPSVRHVAMSSPWWKELDKGSNPHVRSAIAHGLYYMRFAKR